MSLNMTILISRHPCEGVKGSLFISQSQMENRRILRIHWSLCSDCSAGSCWMRSSGKVWNCWWSQSPQILDCRSPRSLCFQIRQTEAEELSWRDWRWWGRGEQQRSWWGSLEIGLWRSSLLRYQEMTDHVEEWQRERNLTRQPALRSLWGHQPALRSLWGHFTNPQLNERKPAKDTKVPASIEVIVESLFLDPPPP